MNGEAIKIDDSELQKDLQGIIDRLQNKRKALSIIGAIGRESVRSNFREGGRPTRWRRSKRAIADSGQTLRDSNRLMNSITSQVENDRVIIGTNDERAGTHHYGAIKGSFGTVAAKVGTHQRITKKGTKYMVKEHSRKMTLPWGTIPARQFMVLQDEDLITIEEVMAEHIMKGESH